ncbi:MAG: hypothetical protein QXY90_04635 [Candidatus Anstonellales archaeon]
MQLSSNKVESKKRLNVVKKINQYVIDSNLSGLLVTGSLAWGKNTAVTESSDIDFYLLAPSLEDFKNSLEELPEIPSQTKRILIKMLEYTVKKVNTRSIKTDIGQYFGAIYLFTEEDLDNLAKQLEGSTSKFFDNLRPHDFAQSKKYRGLSGNEISFTTPISKTGTNSLWIRKDPLLLIKNKEFFGSIFISHLLYGEIYTDKNDVLYKTQALARKFVKSVLPKEKKKAFVAFKNYLPRIDRMDSKTVSKLFNSIWLS